jgi:hypothetical protein
MAGAGTKRRARPSPVAAPEVRGQLLRLDRLDAALRSQWVATEFTDRVLERKLEALNTSGIEWLREVIAQHGWPGRKLVGSAASEAACRLLQHVDSPPAFQRRCLRLLREAAERGDVPLRHVAYVTDAMRVREGRKQLFGTKFRKENGELVPYPIEKEAELEARRKQMQLEPLPAYARRLRRRYLPSRTGER